MGVFEKIVGSMPIVGPVLGAATSLLGIESQRKGQSQANAQNIDIARHQYQWAVEDMKRAGLNPIMAASQGIHGATAAPMQNPYQNAGMIASSSLGNAVSSGTDIYRAGLEKKRTTSQITVDKSVALLNKATQNKVYQEELLAQVKATNVQVEKFILETQRKLQTEALNIKQIYREALEFVWRGLKPNIIKGLRGDQNEISEWFNKAIWPTIKDAFKTTSPLGYFMED